jgi:hypothetical protein
MRRPALARSSFTEQHDSGVAACQQFDLARQLAHGCTAAERGQIG